MYSVNILCMRRKAPADGFCAAVEHMGSVLKYFSPCKGKPMQEMHRIGRHICCCDTLEDIVASLTRKREAFLLSNDRGKSMRAMTCVLSA